MVEQVTDTAGEEQKKQQDQSASGTPDVAEAGFEIVFDVLQAACDAAAATGEAVCTVGAAAVECVASVFDGF
jgi:hypothetical protein